MKAETQLRHEVLNELQWDPSVDANEVGVMAKAELGAATERRFDHLRKRQPHPAHYHCVAPAPAAPASPEALPSHEMVARRAYEIWQRHGCRDGTAFHDWMASEAELRCNH